MERPLEEYSKEELVELVKGMSWAALDLAQHLAVTNDLTAEALRPMAYKQAESMAYSLAARKFETTNGIAVFDDLGLQIKREGDANGTN